MNWDIPKTYAVKHIDSNVVEASRSGGIFTDSGAECVMFNIESMIDLEDKMPDIMKCLYVLEVTLLNLIFICLMLLVLLIGVIVENFLLFLRIVLLEI